MTDSQGPDSPLPPPSKRALCNRRNRANRNAAKEAVDKKMAELEEEKVELAVEMQKMNREGEKWRAVEVERGNGGDGGNV